MRFPALVLVLDLFELGVEHVVLAGFVACRTRRIRASAGAFRLVGALHDRRARLGQRLGLVLDGRLVVALQHAAQVRNRRFDRGAFLAHHLVAEVLHRLLGRMHERVSASSRNFLSSAACASASRIICLISSSESPLEALMTIFCSFPVALSFADTCRMPFASMSNVTSICGRPRGAGGMSERSNLPSDLLSLARSRSPCSTWIVTPLWLSSAVEKTCVALVGIVVFFSMRRVMTPPSVSMPSESGVTSSSSTSFTSPASTPP